MSVLFEKFMKNLLKYGLEHFGIYYSEYEGTCFSNKDEKEQGRVRVIVPTVSGGTPLGAWAWPKMPMAGRDKGTFGFQTTGIL